MLAVPAWAPRKLNALGETSCGLQCLLCEVLSVVLERHDSICVEGLRAELEWARNSRLGVQLCQAKPSLVPILCSLEQWFSECGSQVSHMSITWTFRSNSNSQVLPQTSRIRNSEGGPSNQCLTSPPGDSKAWSLRTTFLAFCVWCVLDYQGSGLNTALLENKSAGAPNQAFSNKIQSCFHNLPNTFVHSNYV